MRGWRAVACWGAVGGGGGGVEGGAGASGERRDAMGLPIRKELLDSHGAVARNSGADDGGPDCVFEYGNLRPDADPDIPLVTSVATKAWLLGSRLYSFSHGGLEHPAVRLEEPGYAVLGYVVKASRGMGILGLLEETQRRQYVPELYERDVVEVCTETGERVRCYVYHRPDVERTRPIHDGDWCTWSIQGEIESEACKLFIAGKNRQDLYIHTASSPVSRFKQTDRG